MIFLYSSGSWLRVQKTSPHSSGGSRASDRVRGADFRGFVTLRFQGYGSSSFRLASHWECDTLVVDVIAIDTRLRNTVPADSSSGWRVFYSGRGYTRNRFSFKIG